MAWLGHNELINRSILKNILMGVIVWNKSWIYLLFMLPCSEIWVIAGSGNGLLPDGTKPLPETKLTTSNHQWGPVAFTWEQFHLNAQDSSPWDEFENYWFKITATSPRDHWVKELPHWYPEVSLSYFSAGVSDKRVILDYFYWWCICFNGLILSEICENKTIELLNLDPKCEKR